MPPKSRWAFARQKTSKKNKTAQGVAQAARGCKGSLRRSAACRFLCGPFSSSLRFPQFPHGPRPGRPPLHPCSPGRFGSRWLACGVGVPAFAVKVALPVWRRYSVALARLRGLLWWQHQSVWRIPESAINVARRDPGFRHPNVLKRIRITKDKLGTGRTARCLPKCRHLALQKGQQFALQCACSLYTDVPPLYTTGYAE